MFMFVLRLGIYTCGGSSAGLKFHKLNKPLECFQNTPYHARKLTVFAKQSWEIANLFDHTKGCSRHKRQLLQLPLRCDDEQHEPNSNSFHALAPLFGDAEFIAQSNALFGVLELDETRSRHPPRCRAYFGVVGWSSCFRSSPALRWI